MPINTNYEIEDCCKACRTPTLVVDALSYPNSDIEPTVAVLHTLPAAAFLEALGIRHRSTPDSPRMEKLVALLVDSLLLHREALCRLVAPASTPEGVDPDVETGDNWDLAEDVVSVGIRPATVDGVPLQVRVDIGMVECDIEAAEEERDELRPTYTTAEA